MAINPEDGNWVSLQELYDEVGETEAQRLAKTKNTDTDENITRKLRRAMTTADTLIDRVLSSAGYALPLTAKPDKEDELEKIVDLIRLCGAKISHWQLYDTR